MIIRISIRRDGAAVVRTDSGWRMVCESAEQARAYAAGMRDGWEQARSHLRMAVLGGEGE